MHLGGEAKGFEAGTFVRTMPVDAIARASQLAITAARLALDDAGLAPGSIEPAAAGVSMETTSGEPEMIGLRAARCLRRALPRGSGTPRRRCGS